MMENASAQLLWAKVVRILLKEFYYIKPSAASQIVPFFFFFLSQGLLSNERLAKCTDLPPSNSYMFLF